MNNLRRQPEEEHTSAILAPKERNKNIMKKTIIDATALINQQKHLSYENEVAKIIFHDALSGLIVSFFL
jgi:hypothetical protein